MSKGRSTWCAVVLTAICAGTANADFTAYNDACNASSGNVTAYQTQAGYTLSGLLKDYATGVDTGVTATATYSGNNAYWSGNPTALFPAGTDAAVFNNIINYVGDSELNADTDWFGYDFSGLDPARNYTFVTTANRQGGSTYLNRLTKFSIIGAASYVNQSSAGTTVAADGSYTIFTTGENTTTGYVAKWTFSPSPNGTVSFRTARGTAGTKAYGFQEFMLQENPVPEPASLGLLAIGALGLISRRRRA